MKSLSEIDIVSKRASKASGYTWGEAEEIGKNIRLLESFGLPGLKNINNFFKLKQKKKFEFLRLLSQKNKSQKYQLCPITIGIGLMDQIKNLEKYEKINFINVSHPLLFLPFVSRASEIIGKRIFIKMDDKDFLLNFNLNIYSNFLKNEIITDCKLITAKIIDNFDTFSELEWAEIYKLSENTFVDESDSLKNTSAGAGLTDND